jgi:streptomycin 6-kinase
VADRIDIPAEVRGKVASQGAAGRRWLKALPNMVTDLETEWSLSVGRVLTGGTESFVADVVTHSGQRAVLKVALPGRDVSHEIECLLLGAGHGYVRLIKYDRKREAMLQERLGDSLARSSLPIPKQVEIICRTLCRAWEAPPDGEFLSGAEKARSLDRFIHETWDTLGRPVSSHVIRQVAICARSREEGFDPESAVLAHGDPHASNLLADPATQGYTFVDPDGLFVEPAYDLGVLMREWSDELLAAGNPLRVAWERCRLLSQLTGVDPEPIWEWGLLERVSTGLLAMLVGLEGGREMLTVAERLVSL